MNEPDPAPGAHGTAPIPGLRIREARAADNDAIFEVMHREPTPEVLGVAGTADKARALGRLVPLVPDRPRSGEETFVGELHSNVVGVLQLRFEDGDRSTSPAVLFRFLRVLLEHYPPRDWIKLLGRLNARTELTFPPVEDSCHVAEVHVHPDRRDRGIGSALLRFAESQARERRCRRMSLTTHASNPARHLYQRFGFRVVETRTNPRYEKATGIPGRVLMVKELDEPA